MVFTSMHDCEKLTAVSEWSESETVNLQLISQITHYDAKSAKTYETMSEGKHS